MEKRKIILYPYDIESAPLVRHCGALGYDIAGCVSLPGLFPAGKDAGSVDKGPATGIIVSHALDKCLAEADALFVNQPSIPMVKDSRIIHAIRTAVDASKEILCAFPLPDRVRIDTEEACRKKSLRFTYWPLFGSARSGPPPDFEQSQIEKIDTPVIAVLGVAEQTHKFEIQLCLRDYFTGKGYRVSQVGSRHYSELFGFHRLPDFMFSRQYLEHEKVFAFNRFIKEIEDTEKPDIIIIGTSGALLPLNERFCNRFGITAYEVCSGIRPDIVVASTYYMDFSREYYTELNNFCRYHLGIEVDFFNLANKNPDWQYIREMGKMKFVVHTSEMIDEIIAGSAHAELPLFNILNTGKTASCFDTLEKKLIAYSEVLHA